MLSGKENVGAAISEPCLRLMSSFSARAERRTISRQRPLYFDLEIQDFQKCAVSRQRRSTSSSRVSCSPGLFSARRNVAVWPARRQKDDVTSSECALRSTVECSDSGEMRPSLGRKVAQRLESCSLCADVP